MTGNGASGNNVSERMADVEAACQRIAYGEVRITLCGGRIVQVDATNKQRF